MARYRGAYDEGWEELRISRHARALELGLVDAAWEMSPPDPSVPDWKDLSEEQRVWYRRAMEVYAAQVDRMDQGIGHIIESLERSGTLENSLFVFLADNGGCDEVLSDEWRGIYMARETHDGRRVVVGNENRSVLPGPEDTYMSYGPGWANASNTPFRLYKHWVHEGGISAPLIVHWPDRIAAIGELVDEPGHVIDIMATAIDAAGATYPTEWNDVPVHPLEGRSLLPAIDGRPMEREALYWEHEGNRAVRRGRWKLVAEHDGSWELYDLETDRTELDDLADREPETRDELVEMYDAGRTGSACSRGRCRPACRSHRRLARKATAQITKTGTTAIDLFQTDRQGRETGREATILPGATLTAGSEVGAVCVALDGAGRLIRSRPASDSISAGRERFGPTAPAEYASGYLQLGATCLGVARVDGPTASLEFPVPRSVTSAPSSTRATICAGRTVPVRAGS